ncbi:MAG: hypothetical protein AB7T49_03085 [Oligoflexales bacterium]
MSVVLLTACQTIFSANPKPETVNSRTVLPESFVKDQTTPGKIIVSSNMVALGEISRNSAEVREGPGPEFSLSEILLKKGDIVVLFEKIGNWQKIITPYSEIEGWVHFRAVGDTKKKDKTIELNLVRLPKVFASHEIMQAWDEPEQKEIAVNIPKGTSFPALKIEESKTLVYLTQSNSPVWLSRKDAQ